MKTTQKAKFFLNLAKVQNTLTRRFDGSLGGVSLSEILILYHLSQAPEGALRRVDLAEKVGLTASGITRLLLPMEKIGLVKRKQDEKLQSVRIPGETRVLHCIR
jgi:DNA-binding MarR family transcriptional regulator